MIVSVGFTECILLRWISAISTEVRAGLVIFGPRAAYLTGSWRKLPHKRNYYFGVLWGNWSGLIWGILISWRLILTIEQRQRGTRGNNSPMQLHAMRLFIPLLTRLSLNVLTAIFSDRAWLYGGQKSSMGYLLFFSIFLSSSGYGTSFWRQSFFSFQFFPSTAEQKFDYGRVLLGGYASSWKSEWTLWSVVYLVLSHVFKDFRCLNGVHEIDIHISWLSLKFSALG